MLQCKQLKRKLKAPPKILFHVFSAKIWKNYMIYFDMRFSSRERHHLREPYLQRTDRKRGKLRCTRFASALRSLETSSFETKHIVCKDRDARLGYRNIKRLLSTGDGEYGLWYWRGVVQRMKQFCISNNTVRLSGWSNSSQSP